MAKQGDRGRRLSVYFESTEWAIRNFAALHGVEADPSDLREAVMRQMAALTRDVLALFPNTEGR